MAKKVDVSGWLRAKNRLEPLEKAEKHREKPSQEMSAPLFGTAQALFQVDWSTLGELVEAQLETDTTPRSVEELYGEIADWYRVLLDEAGIRSFNVCSFPDAEDCRMILVDGRKVDFDGLFRHNASRANDALYAIDALLGDVGLPPEVVLPYIARCLCEQQGE